MSVVRSLFATLPTHDHMGAEIDLRWNHEQLHETILRALTASTDKEKSLRALLSTLMFLDYALYKDSIRPSGGGSSPQTLVRN